MEYMDQVKPMTQVKRTDVETFRFVFLWCSCTYCTHMLRGHWVAGYIQEMLASSSLCTPWSTTTLFE